MPPALGKDFPVTIHLGLLGALVLGVWFIAAKVSEWEDRLERIEGATRHRWSVQMEHDAWAEYERTKQKPDIDRIRGRYDLP